MNILEQKLLDFFNKKSNIDLKELKKGLNIDSESKEKALNSAIKNLEIEGYVHLNKNNTYSVIRKESKIQQGKVYYSANGNGNITTNDNVRIIIPSKYLKGVIQGDVISVNNLVQDAKGNVYGTLDKIIYRKNNQITCEVVFVDGELRLLPYNSKSKSYIDIDKKQLNKYGAGELLLIKLNTGNTEGTIIKKIGHKDEPDIDEKSIAYDYGFEVEFSSKALKELEKIPSLVDSNKAIKEGRRDLRNKRMFTIDGKDTKDIDDSIGIESLPNGNIKLYVNIADVGYYVKEGTVLYEEAYQRATSVYMNDTVIPMLPHKISNGICSLHPHVDRLTKTCEMIIDESGNVVDYEIYDSIINSSKKMNYDDVNKIVTNDEMVSGYEEFYDDLKVMNALSKILNAAKDNRGYINFCKKDIKAKGKNNSITFEARVQQDAEKLIENFMLLANETVATHIYYRALPFLYRVHETPDEDKIRAFLTLLEESEHEYNFKNCKNITSNKFIQNIANQLLKNEDYIMLEELLKTMKKAKYLNINLQHFGLALKIYTHFTSPIRRFCDLKVHNLLDLYKKPYLLDDNELNESLKEISNHISQRSRDAEKAERDAKSMRMAEYMESKIGMEFDSVVTSVSQTTLTIKTNNEITGKIDISDLFDDNYVYNCKKNCLTGKNTRNIIKIGYPIKVVIKDASKKNRSICFTTASGYKNKRSNEKKLVNKNKTKKTSN